MKASCKCFWKIIRYLILLLPDSTSTTTKLSPDKSSPDSPTQSKINRDIVLKDIVESERTNVAELQGLVNSYLQPLEASNL